MGRSQTIANNQAAAVPSLCVLVPHTLLLGLDPQSNDDEVDKRVQQLVFARNDVNISERQQPRWHTTWCWRYVDAPALPWSCNAHARRLIALVSVSMQYPTGSLFSDCQGVALPQLVATASNRATWHAKVSSLS